MRVLVTGDRAFAHGRFLRAVLDGLLASCPAEEEFVLIEGQCPTGGADRLAERWARSHSPRVDHAPFPAPWNEPCRSTCRAGHRRQRPDGTDYCPAAGNYRNVQMLSEGEPDVVVAFHDNLGSSRGTAHMIEAALGAGIPVYHVERLASPPRRSEREGV